MLVKEIMTKDVLTVSPETSLKEVGKILKEKRISGLPVVVEDSIVGIIATSDIMRFILDNIYQVKVAEESFPELKISELFEEEKTKVKVRNIMSKNVHTLSEDNTIDDVMRLMFVKGIHTLPVTKEGKLVGIVGQRDLVSVCF